MSVLGDWFVDLVIAYVVLLVVEIGGWVLIGWVLIGPIDRLMVASMISTATTAARRLLL